MGFWAGLELVERCYCPEGVLTIQSARAAAPHAATITRRRPIDTPSLRRLPCFVHLPLDARLPAYRQSTLRPFAARNLNILQAPPNNVFVAVSWQATFLPRACVAEMDIVADYIAHPSPDPPIYQATPASSSPPSPRYSTPGPTKKSEI